MYRNWLPVASNLSDQIRGLNDLTLREKASRLHGLSNLNLDFTGTIKVDRELQKLPSLPGFDELPLTKVRLAVFSTSTTYHLIAPLRVACFGRRIWLETFEPEYGQFLNELYDPNSSANKFQPNVVLFAHDPYSLFGSDKFDETRVESKIAEVKAQWKAARDLWGATIIQQRPFNPVPRLAGENETRLPDSIAASIESFKNQLVPAANADGIDIIDLPYWCEKIGIDALHSVSLWNKSKQEIHPGAGPLYGDLVARLIAARFGKSAKCLVLDLDNTLWSGVIGDDGLEGIVIGQGSSIGEGHLYLQRYAKQLAKRGVILAVSSKNDDAVARNAFEKHPEFLLRMSDFSAFKANWIDKATNIREIAAELNIGLDAIVFVDDNPFERNLVREAIPEVMVPEMPEDIADYANIISASGFFEAVTFSTEDANKTEQYRTNADRKALLQTSTDIGSYLSALEMTLKAYPFDDIGLVRVVQLINKTNQFNLTTKRYTEAQVRNMLQDPNVVTRQLRLIDRFGDNGVIATVIANYDEAAQDLGIETWLMSCRVLGRQVENATLKILVDAGKALGASTISGEYLPSGRNDMVKDLYEKLGFTKFSDDDGRTRWSLRLADHVTREIPINIEENHD
jgi:FkbH-like protein